MTNSTKQTTRNRLLSGLVALILATGGALAACSSTPQPGPDASASPTEQRTPPPTTSYTDAELQEHIINQYWKFWEALKQAELGNPDITLFDGLAHGHILNEILATAEQRRIEEAPRLGEPVWTSDLEVIIYEDQESVDVVACVDRGSWVPASVTEPQEEVVQYTLSFHNIYDEWVVAWIDADMQACLA